MTEAEQLVAQFKEERQARGFYTVAIYLIDRAYGGPEEGGWYYDCGTPYLEPEAALHMRAFDRLSDAYHYSEHLNLSVLPAWNEGRAEVSSVLSEGQYKALWSEGFPQPFPTSRPHYE
jgi:hypothetical protein